MQKWVAWENIAKPVELNWCFRESFIRIVCWPQKQFLSEKSYKEIFLKEVVLGFWEGVKWTCEEIIYNETCRVPSVKYVLSQKMHGIVLVLNKRVGMHKTSLHFQNGNDTASRWIFKLDWDNWKFYLFLQNLWNSFIKLFIFGEPCVSVGTTFLQYFTIFLFSI